MGPPLFAEQDTEPWHPTDMGVQESTGLPVTPALGMEHWLWEEPWSYQGQVQKGGAKNLTSLPRVMGQSALGQRSPSVGSWCEHWVPCSLAVVQCKAGLDSLSLDSSEGPSALQQAGPQGLLVSTFFFIRWPQSSPETVTCTQFHKDSIESHFKEPWVS